LLKLDLYHDYCLMANHYHWLVEPKANLSIGMRQVSGGSLGFSVETDVEKLRDENHTAFKEQFVCNGSGSASSATSLIMI
jgi:hypothetical protein